MCLEDKCAVASILWELPHGCKLLGSSDLGGGEQIKHYEWTSSDLEQEK